jgi:hypothetical protein
MRFLVDAQLPPVLCGWFEERGSEAEHVSRRLGGQTPDAEIAAYAAGQALVLVTKDDDFALTHPPADYRAGLAPLRQHHQPSVAGMAAGALDVADGEAGGRGGPDRSPVVGE